LKKKINLKNAPQKMTSFLIKKIKKKKERKKERRRRMVDSLGEAR
jgi:hypothetical protein